MTINLIVVGGGSCNESKLVLEGTTTFATDVAALVKAQEWTTGDGVLIQNMSDGYKAKLTQTMIADVEPTTISGICFGITPEFYGYYCHIVKTTSRLELALNGHFLTYFNRNELSLETYPTDSLGTQMLRTNSAAVFDPDSSLATIPGELVEGKEIEVSWY